MTDEQHWQAWLERWGVSYSTDEERLAAYRDHQAELARMTEIFDAADPD